MNKLLINTLSKYFTNQPIEKAWLFGSYARSEEEIDSDVDILVNFIPDSKITLFKYVKIVNELRQLTGKNIDMVEVGQLKKYAQNSADKEKILIYERKTKR
jgi:predicted nucleotidyltransferase